MYWRFMKCDLREDWQSSNFPLTVSCIFIYHIIGGFLQIQDQWMSSQWFQEKLKSEMMKKNKELEEMRHQAIVDKEWHHKIIPFLFGLN